MVNNLSSDNRKTYIHYIKILYDKYNTRPRVPSAPSRQACASTWQSHVALRATSHPRGPARKIPPFFALYLIHLIDKNSK